MSDVREQLRMLRNGARALAKANTEAKRALIRMVADRLASEQDAILEANALDVAQAKRAGLSVALIDRLTLTPARLESLADACRNIAALPDPIGETSDARVLDNGLRIERVRVPLGVIAMIYESRPNVTIEAAVLCWMSGNACALRGGKEATHTNRVFADILNTCARHAGLTTHDRAIATLLPADNRDNVKELCEAVGLVDLLIPRGGEGLIHFVQEHARVPTIFHYKGVCHIYVDATANLEHARAILHNAKVQRPGVCNAMETVLVHAQHLPQLVDLLELLASAKVELRCDERSFESVRNAHAKVTSVVAAIASDWDAEYLDKIVSIKIVASLDEALAHIETHGSHHTEAILTEDLANAERFLREVDASLVLHNASTRFNDGGELGLGAEMGISTSKLHAYGAMGLKELTTQKWVARGEGQIRS